MLPKSLRLSRRGFEAQKGLLRVTTPHFSISYGRNPYFGGSAVIVPKKVIKSAVGRHTLKRQIRAILTPFSTKEQTIIVFARSGSGARSFTELEHELSTALTAILAK